MSGKEKQTAVAYFRTSSVTNVGEDKDSLTRQQDAVRRYAKAQRLDIVREFYDAGVSGTDPVNERRGFADMLEYMLGNGARIVLVETANRFARDLMVQLVGHDLLKAKGISLVPVDAPNHFTDETPTAIMVRQILGSVAQFEKTALVQRLRKGRERKASLGDRGVGRLTVAERAPEAVKRARELHAQRLSLRQIAGKLAAENFLGATGKPYSASVVSTLIGDGK